jgi:hypothetical protein
MLLLLRVLLHPATAQAGGGGERPRGSGELLLLAVLPAGYLEACNAPTIQTQRSKLCNTAIDV